MADKHYSLASQIAEVERELRWRTGVYRSRVASRAMRQSEADLQMGLMRSVLATLRWLAANEAAIKAKVGDADRPR